MNPDSENRNCLSVCLFLWLFSFLTCTIILLHCFGGFLHGDSGDADPELMGTAGGNIQNSAAGLQWGSERKTTGAPRRKT